MDSSSTDNDLRERVYYVRANPDFVDGSDVFAIARSSFLWLVAGPDPVSVDGREIPGLPSRPVPLDELGTLLLDTACTQATRDAAWAYLITRARAEGSTWTMACVGLALPMLLRVAAIVTRQFSGDTHDLNAAVLTGFLAELHKVNLARRAILAWLYWAAYREGLLALHEAVGGPIPVEDLGFESAPPPPPKGHPDLVLAAAVKVAAITVEEAELIAETRVGEASLAEASQVRGQSYKATAKTRERAESRLAAYLGEEPKNTPATPPVQRSGKAEGRPARRRGTPARSTTQPARTPGAALRTVSRAGAAPDKKVRRSVSQDGQKPRNDSRRSRLPSDRHPRALRTISGPAAYTGREVRSCD